MSAFSYFFFAKASFLAVLASAKAFLAASASASALALSASDEAFSAAAAAAKTAC